MAKPPEEISARARAAAGVVRALALSGCPHLSGPGRETLPLPAQLRDARGVMAGICFEAAHSVAGQVFVFRDAAALDAFYDRVDDGGFCSRPVARQPFDFGGGPVLTGLWSAGTGCTARHDVISVERNDNARAAVIRLRFVSAGDCPYALLRPWWVSLPVPEGFAVRIEIEA